MPEAENLTRHWALHWTCLQTPVCLPWNLPFCAIQTKTIFRIMTLKIKIPENKHQLSWLYLYEDK